ncbi:MAG: hypothetical protein FWF10_09170 [Clostridiales bacterium]|nr:hypothetical protein [Clostridiales bacterium]
MKNIWRNALLVCLGLGILLVSRAASAIWIQVGPNFGDGFELVIGEVREVYVSMESWTYGETPSEPIVTIKDSSLLYLEELEREIPEQIKDLEANMDAGDEAHMANLRGMQQALQNVKDAIAYHKNTLANAIVLMEEPPPTDAESRIRDTDMATEMNDPEPRKVEVYISYVKDVFSKKLTNETLGLLLESGLIPDTDILYEKPTAPGAYIVIATVYESNLLQLLDGGMRVNNAADDAAGLAVHAIRGIDHFNIYGDVSVPRTGDTGAVRIMVGLVILSVAVVLISAKGAKNTKRVSV